MSKLNEDQILARLKELSQIEPTPEATGRTIQKVRDILEICDRVYSMKLGNPKHFDVSGFGITEEVVVPGTPEFVYDLLSRNDVIAFRLKYAWIVCPLHYKDRVFDVFGME